MDDEAVIVLMVAGWIEDLGCEVETAFNGTEALTKLSGGPHIELLITDVTMPGISGYELAEPASDIQPGLKVVLLSGAETDPHGLPLIRKPFLLHDLRRTIEATAGPC